MWESRVFVLTEIKSHHHPFHLRYLILAKNIHPAKFQATQKQNISRYHKRPLFPSISHKGKVKKEREEKKEQDPQNERSPLLPSQQPLIPIHQDRVQPTLAPLPITTASPLLRHSRQPHRLLSPDLTSRIVASTEKVDGPVERRRGQPLRFDLRVAMRAVGLIFPVTAAIISTYALAPFPPGSASN